LLPPDQSAWDFLGEDTPTVPDTAAPDLLDTSSPDQFDSASTDLADASGPDLSDVTPPDLPDLPDLATEIADESWGGDGIADAPAEMEAQEVAYDLVADLGPGDVADEVLQQDIYVPDSLADMVDDGGVEQETVSPDIDSGCQGIDECEAELSPGLCTAAACLEGACLLVAMEDGTPCPVPVCSVSASCLAGVCIDVPLDCDDSDPCTLDFCADTSGICQHVAANNPCDDGDPCTADDWCVAGECHGLPISCAPGHECVGGSCECTASCAGQACGETPCGESCGSCDDGFECDQGQCVCLATCQGMECGESLCGEACGQCEADEDCLGGLCVALSYPAGPYGPFKGDTMPDQEFLDPDTLDARHMGEFYGDGRLLLITYNAGWCIVCKNDTSLLNNWVADWYDDGLRILSVLYELPSGKPANQEYAQWWDDFYNLTYEFWMDQPGLGPDGKAAGGALYYYLQPNGPVPDNVFPVTLLVCPQTMEILYISQGFYDDVGTPLVEQYLFDVDCWQ